MILLTALRVSVSSEAPWYSGGYSIEPTPTMTLCPGISRGTELLVFGGEVPATREELVRLRLVLSGLLGEGMDQVEVDLAEEQIPYE